MDIPDYYEGESEFDKDIEKAKEIIETYFRKDPFLLNLYTEGKDGYIEEYKNDPNLCWLRDAETENGYIRSLISNELIRWCNIEDVRKIILDSTRFMHYRLIDNDKLFPKHTKDQLREKICNDIKIAQRMFEKRFSKLRKKYGID